MNKKQVAKCIRKLAEALEDDVEEEITESLSGHILSEQEAGDIKEILENTRK